MIGKKTSKRVAKRVNAELDLNHEKYTASTRMKWMERWMEICGTDTVEGIDYDNPYVHLEWLLCDLRVTAKLSGNKVDEALAMMDDMQR